MTKAFILGAGATRAVYPNCPLDNDFFDKLRSFCPDLEGRLSEELSKIMPEFRKAGLEKVLMTIESESSPTTKMHLREDIYKGIYRLIAEHTDSNIGFDQTFNNPKPTTYHKTLVSKCNDNDFFITLNYDLTLDMAVWADRADYNNKWSIIDYGFSEGDKLGSNLFVVNMDHKKSVYHLHGSLNWGIKKDGEMKAYRSAIPPLRSSSQLNPFIVLPGPKEYPTPIENIWNAAKRRLEGADELIVIGCSLNPGDRKLLELIGEWLIGHFGAKKKVVYLKQNKGDKWYYNEMLGEDTLFFDKGFNLEAIEFIFNE